MAITQMETDREVTLALDKLAASYNKSRRQWCADYMKETVEQVPGLMEAVRNELANGFVAPDPSGIKMGTPIEPRTDFRSDGKGGFKDTTPKVKGYRFMYLDEEQGFLDGWGFGPLDALKEATGREWTAEEFYEIFRPLPEYIT